MLQTGDLAIYSTHGICRIDEICDKTYAGKTRTYYVLRPIENSSNLTAHIPVENGKTLLRNLIGKAEAKEVLQSFHSEGIEWIERPQKRALVYGKMINTGSRLDIAKLANTLIRKRNEIEDDGKKLNESDRQLLMDIKNIFFREIAFALNTNVDDITKKVNRILAV
ncbi:hypothetical protein JNUCC1_00806 [Lentibacillus sp. JNUCC-1]|uniref:CarD family transcriptional regulator n=1 Tax=Lentibacillus sp. JNUCC-1 TaxID=2654513 RepID=UPI0012E77476|nr:CarD family transcriptional regulator [Lentibacillus sp. JNUCC-1]MUV37000.1 hypothetical protein [Lentibacillus sp. JNUCC-1]